ncbi:MULTISPECIES: phage tail tape measure protein [unclassified Rhizobium]|uniref:phage tail tape measure protein n=1 Tax=unclassified Rhizobium TaxID=2613769 RepID=UPI002479DF8E|nr:MULTISPECIES: phage tail tape measure protein [unclassified Rhizobium]MDH7802227.1 TP901 family phage tail tape measure protein [Rhizobium sp. AN70]
MDVSLRLRLQNQFSREAKVVKRDLHELGDEAKKLGQVKAGKLDAGLKEIRREADRGEKSVSNLNREARKLGNVNTGTAVRNLQALDKAGRSAAVGVRHAHDKMRDIGRLNGNNFEKMAAPAGRLGNTLSLIGVGATSAFAGLAAFASVDNIVRGLEQMASKFRDLNREIASVAVTAETRTPEAIEKIGKSNSTLSLRYGVEAPQVNAARKTYAAAGVGLDQQEAILDPTLKAAKAGDSTGETIGSAVIALQQNLGVKDTEVPAALDMMAKGTKLGSFEVDAMAKNFPKLATLYAGTGRTGLNATAELVALAQIVRMGAGTQDQASTNLENILAKLSSPDTVKNFDEKGVDIEAIKKRSEKNGTPYMLDLVDKVMELTKGDEFRIGELFGDMQAKQALLPLINFREKYNEFLKEIRDNSAGTVDEDYEFLRTLPKERADRRGAALSDAGTGVGQWWDSVSSPFKDWFARTVNPAYAREEDAHTERQRLKETDIGELEAYLAERQKKLAAIPAPKGDVDIFSSAKLLLVEEIMQLKQELESARRARSNGDLGKSTGAIPVPIEKPLSTDLSGAAQKSMQGYNEALAAEGDKAATEAQIIADRIRSALDFTVAPTIAPNYVPPAAAPAAAPTGEKHSSLQQSNNIRQLTQNITTPNVKLAAVKARREQSRAIEQARSRSFYDLGPRLA